MSSKAKLHARRRAARFGDLDALLVEALKSQGSKPEGGNTKRLKGINEHLHEQFANPLNWTDRGVLLIIYVDEVTKEQTTIGMFQERIHKTGARRLLRVAADTTPSIHFEEWNDPYLIDPPEVPQICTPVPNPYEQMAIRDYLSRTKEQKLEDFLGISKPDAAALLKQLKDIGVEKLR